jgi:hypothetical protein
MNCLTGIIRRRQAVTLMLALSIFLAAPSSPAWPAEYGTGVYVLGYQSTMAGYLPPPGFYLRNDLFFYQGNAQISHSAVISNWICAIA